MIICNHCVYFKTIFVYFIFRLFLLLAAWNKTNSSTLFSIFWEISWEWWESLRVTDRVLRHCELQVLDANVRGVYILTKFFRIFLQNDRYIWLDERWVTNLYDSPNKFIFALILDLHSSLHITLTLEKLIILFPHVNLQKKKKKRAFFSIKNIHTTIFSFIHNFIYQKFIHNTSFSFTTFSLSKVKLLY